MAIDVEQEQIRQEAAARALTGEAARQEEKPLEQKPEANPFVQEGDKQTGEFWHGQMATTGFETEEGLQAARQSFERLMLRLELKRAIERSKTASARRARDIAGIKVQSAAEREAFDNWLEANVQGRQREAARRVQAHRIAAGIARELSMTDLMQDVPTGPIVARETEGSINLALTQLREAQLTALENRVRHESNGILDTVEQTVKEMTDDQDLSHITDLAIAERIAALTGAFKQGRVDAPLAELQRNIPTYTRLLAEAGSKAQIIPGIEARIESLRSGAATALAQVQAHAVRIRIEEKPMEQKPEANPFVQEGDKQTGEFWHGQMATTGFETEEGLQAARQSFERLMLRLELKRAIERSRTASARRARDNARIEALSAAGRRTFDSWLEANAQERQEESAGRAQAHRIVNGIARELSTTDLMQDVPTGPIVARETEGSINLALTQLREAQLTALENRVRHESNGILDTVEQTVKEMTDDQDLSHITDLAIAERIAALTGAFKQGRVDAPLAELQRNIPTYTRLLAEAGSKAQIIPGIEARIESLRSRAETALAQVQAHAAGLRAENVQALEREERRQRGAVEGAKAQTARVLAQPQDLTVGAVQGYIDSLENLLSTLTHEAFKAEIRALIGQLQTLKSTINPFKEAGDKEVPDSWQWIANPEHVQRVEVQIQGAIKYEQNRARQASSATPAPAEAQVETSQEAFGTAFSESSAALVTLQELTKKARAIHEPYARRVNNARTTDELVAVYRDFVRVVTEDISGPASALKIEENAGRWETTVQALPEMSMAREDLDRNISWVWAAWRELQAEVQGTNTLIRNRAGAQNRAIKEAQEQEEMARTAQEKRERLLAASRLINTIEDQVREAVRWAHSAIGQVIAFGQQPLTLANALQERLAQYGAQKITAFGVQQRAIREMREAVGRLRRIVGQHEEETISALLTRLVGIESVLTDFTQKGQPGLVGLVNDRIAQLQTTEARAIEAVMGTAEPSQDKGAPVQADTKVTDKFRALAPNLWFENDADLTQDQIDQIFRTFPPVYEKDYAGATYFCSRPALEDNGHSFPRAFVVVYLVRPNDQGNLELNLRKLMFSASAALPRIPTHRDSTFNENFDWIGKSNFGEQAIDLPFEIDEFIQAIRGMGAEELYTDKEGISNPILKDTGSQIAPEVADFTIVRRNGTRQALMIAGFTNPEDPASQYTLDGYGPDFEAGFINEYMGHENLYGPHYRSLFYSNNRQALWLIMRSADGAMVWVSHPQPAIAAINRFGAKPDHLFAVDPRLNLGGYDHRANLRYFGIPRGHISHQHPLERAKSYWCAAPWNNQMPIVQDYRQWVAGRSQPQAGEQRFGLHGRRSREELLNHLVPHTKDQEVTAVFHSILNDAAPYIEFLIRTGLIQVTAQPGFLSEHLPVTDVRLVAGKDDAIIHQHTLSIGELDYDRLPLLVILLHEWIELLTNNHETALQFHDPQANEAWKTELQRRRTSTKKAVVIGIGAIARGYLADMLQQSNYAITFVDRHEDSVAFVEGHGGYNLWLLGNEYPAAYQVSQNKRVYASALNIHDVQAVSTIVAADIVFVSIYGSTNGEVSEVLSRALAQRISQEDPRPLNVIVIANTPGADTELRGLILARGELQEVIPRAQELLGVSSGLIDRIVPFSRTVTSRSRRRQTNQDNAFMVVENYSAGLQVSARGWKGPQELVSDISELTFVQDMDEARLQKLYTLNTAHAVAAFLGHLRGYTYIHEAMEDLYIRMAVEHVLNGVLDVHPDWEDEASQKIIARLRNPEMFDPILRVARSPLNKLAGHERLIGVAVEFADKGLALNDICAAIAAALMYDDPREPQALVLAEQMGFSKNGWEELVHGFLRKTSGLDQEYLPIIDGVIAQIRLFLVYQDLKKRNERLDTAQAHWNDHINVVAPNVFRVARFHQPRSTAVTGPFAGYMDRFHERAPFHDVQEETLRDLFVELLKTGHFQPHIVVHVKEISPEAVVLYLHEMIHLSRLYHDHLTFTLVVEQDVNQFNHDFPSTYHSIHEVLGRPGRRGLLARPIIHVADAGWKTRNSPMTLFHQYQGLMPYNHERTYVHQVILNAGALLLQLPHYGQRHYLVVPSDGIFSFGQVEVNEQSPLTLALYPTQEDNLANKVIAATEGGRVTGVLAKPDQGLYQRCMAPAQAAGAEAGRGLWTLPFLHLWRKDSLERFLQELNDTPMEGSDTSLLELPADFFAAVIEGLFTQDEQAWIERKPAGMDQEDWLNIREIAGRHLQSEGQQVAFLSIEHGSFVDEGHSHAYKERVRGEIRSQGLVSNLKKYPGVEMAGAHGLRGGRIIVRGSGMLTIGDNVTLDNVIIDLEEGGRLAIPSGWVLRDSFVCPACVFEGENGFLNAVLSRRGQMVYPAERQSFAGEAETIMIMARDDQGEVRQVRVTIPYNATRQDIDTLNFEGLRETGLNYRQLQQRIDIVTQQDNIHLLEALIDQEIRSTGLVLERNYQDIGYQEFVSNTAERVVHQQLRGQPIFVTVSARQGAGKTYLAYALKAELESRGKHVIVYEEDFVHKPRSERERLRQEQPEEWLKHRQTWHRWDKYREDMERLRRAAVLAKDQGSQDIKIEGIYRPQDGLTHHEQSYQVHADTIFIVTGFFIDDNSKYEFPSGPGNRLKVYLDISLAESLSVKLDRDFWRDPDDIINLHNTVYFPAFFEYSTIFDPYTSADIAAAVDITDRGRVRVIDRQFREIGSAEGMAPVTFVNRPMVEYQNRTVRIRTEVLVSPGYAVLARVHHPDGPRDIYHTVDLVNAGWRTFATFETDRSMGEQLTVDLLAMPQATAVRILQHPREAGSHEHEFISMKAAGVEEAIVRPIQVQSARFIRSNLTRRRDTRQPAAIAAVSLPEGTTVLAWVQQPDGDWAFERPVVKVDERLIRHVARYTTALGPGQNKTLTFVILKDSQEDDLQVLTDQRREAQRRGTLQQFDREHESIWLGRDMTLTGAENPASASDQNGARLHTPSWAMAIAVLFTLVLHGGAAFVLPVVLGLALLAGLWGIYRLGILSNSGLSAYLAQRSAKQRQAELNDYAARRAAWFTFLEEYYAMVRRQLLENEPLREIFIYRNDVPAELHPYLDLRFRDQPSIPASELVFVDYGSVRINGKQESVIYRWPLMKEAPRLVALHNQSWRRTPQEKISLDQALAQIAHHPVGHVVAEIPGIQGEDGQPKLGALIWSWRKTLSPDLICAIAEGRLQGTMFASLGGFLRENIDPDGNSMINFAVGAVVPGLFKGLILAQAAQAKKDWVPYVLTLSPYSAKALHEHNGAIQFSFGRIPDGRYEGMDLIVMRYDVDGTVFPVRLYSRTGTRLDRAEIIGHQLALWRFPILRAFIEEVLNSALGEQLDRIAVDTNAQHPLLVQLDQAVDPDKFVLNIRFNDPEGHLTIDDFRSALELARFVPLPESWPAVTEQFDSVQRQSSEATPQAHWAEMALWGLVVLLGAPTLLVMIRVFGGDFLRYAFTHYTEMAGIGLAVVAAGLVLRIIWIAAAFLIGEWRRSMHQRADSQAAVVEKDSGKLGRLLSLAAVFTLAPVLANAAQEQTWSIGSMSWGVELLALVAGFMVTFRPQDIGHKKYRNKGDSAIRYIDTQHNRLLHGGMVLLTFMVLGVVAIADQNNHRHDHGDYGQRDVKGKKRIHRWLLSLIRLIASHPFVKRGAMALAALFAGLVFFSSHAWAQGAQWHVVSSEANAIWQFIYERKFRAEGFLLYGVVFWNFSRLYFEGLDNFSKINWVVLVGSSAVLILKVYAQNHMVYGINDFWVTFILMYLASAGLIKFWRLIRSPQTWSFLGWSTGFVFIPAAAGYFFGLPAPKILYRIFLGQIVFLLIGALLFLTILYLTTTNFSIKKIWQFTGGESKETWDRVRNGTVIAGTLFLGPFVVVLEMDWGLIGFLTDYFGILTALSWSAFIYMFFHNKHVFDHIEKALSEYGSALDPEVKWHIPWSQFQKYGEAGVFKAFIGLFGVVVVGVMHPRLLRFFYWLTRLHLFPFWIIPMNFQNPSRGERDMGTAGFMGNLSVTHRQILSRGGLRPHSLSWTVAQKRMGRSGDVRLTWRYFDDLKINVPAGPFNLYGLNIYYSVYFPKYFIWAQRQKDGSVFIYANQPVLDFLELEYPQELFETLLSIIAEKELLELKLIEESGLQGQEAAEQADRILLERYQGTERRALYTELKEKMMIRLPVHVEVRNNRTVVVEFLFLAVPQGFLSEYWDWLRIVDASTQEEITDLKIEAVRGSRLELTLPRDVPQYSIQFNETHVPTSSKGPALLTPKKITPDSKPINLWGRRIFIGLVLAVLGPAAADAADFTSQIISQAMHTDWSSLILAAASVSAGRIAFPFRVSYHRDFDPDTARPYGTALRRRLDLLARTNDFRTVVKIGENQVHYLAHGRGAVGLKMQINQGSRILVILLYSETGYIENIILGPAFGANAAHNRGFRSRWLSWSNIVRDPEQLEALIANDILRESAVIAEYNQAIFGQEEIFNTLIGAQEVQAGIEQLVHVLAQLQSETDLSNYAARMTSALASPDSQAQAVYKGRAVSALISASLRTLDQAQSEAQLRQVLGLTNGAGPLVEQLISLWGRQQVELHGAAQTLFGLNGYRPAPQALAVADVISTFNLAGEIQSAQLQQALVGGFLDWADARRESDEDLAALIAHELDQGTQGGFEISYLDLMERRHREAAVQPAQETTRQLTAEERFFNEAGFLLDLFLRQPSIRHLETLRDLDGVSSLVREASEHHLSDFREYMARLRRLRQHVGVLRKIQIKGAAFTPQLAVARMLNISEDLTEFAATVSRLNTPRPLPNGRGARNRLSANQVFARNAIIMNGVLAHAVYRRMDYLSKQRPDETANQDWDRGPVLESVGQLKADIRSLCGIYARHPAAAMPAQYWGKTYALLSVHEQELREGAYGPQETLHQVRGTMEIISSLMFHEHKDGQDRLWIDEDRNVARPDVGAHEQAIASRAVALLAGLGFGQGARTYFSFLYPSGEPAPAEIKTDLVQGAPIDMFKFLFSAWMKDVVKEIKSLQEAHELTSAYFIWLDAMHETFIAHQDARLATFVQIVERFEGLASLVEKARSPSDVEQGEKAFQEFRVSLLNPSLLVHTLVNQRLIHLNLSRRQKRRLNKVDLVRLEDREGLAARAYAVRKILDLMRISDAYYGELALITGLMDEYPQEALLDRGFSDDVLQASLEAQTSGLTAEAAEGEFKPALQNLAIELNGNLQWLKGFPRLAEAYEPYLQKAHEYLLGAGVVLTADLNPAEKLRVVYDIFFGMTRLRSFVIEMGGFISPGPGHDELPLETVNPVVNNLRGIIRIFLTGPFLKYVWALRRHSAALPQTADPKPPSERSVRHG